MWATLSKVSESTYRRGMLSDKKILITGVTGQIGFPIANFLARNNEVWGVARFTNDRKKQFLKESNIQTFPLDLNSQDYGKLPNDFDHVIHFAIFQGQENDYDLAISNNAEATGLLMSHCRDAKSVLVASTNSVYKPCADPWQKYKETDPLGDSTVTHSPTYGVSKLSQEAVARTMCRVLDLPTTIARINVSYGDNGGLPKYHFDLIADDKPVTLRDSPPSPYSPIHEIDMANQVFPLLEAASVPSTIVNWCGDEVVTAEDWCALFGSHLNKTPQLIYEAVSGSQSGGAADPSLRKSITGPCSVSWVDGMSSFTQSHVK